ncbi:MAG TPA: DUF4443 domain-containing protein [Candidatus Norongarragalinales archaeon]|nr:DUF4443 domain-containing protein [Candidatus Norongarragalinales archaeon]
MDFSLLKPEEKAFGPMPKFVFEDVLRAFWILGRKKLVGRKDLAESLDLGEGTVRSIAAFLEARGLARKIRAGSMLSEKGVRLFERLCARVGGAKQLPPLYSTFERPSFCLQCSVAAEPSVSVSIAVRDAAVKAGSDGLLSLSLKDGRFLFLGTRDAVARKDSVLLSSAFTPRENSVFLLSFAKRALDRERGAWAAFLILEKAIK